jgi:hypothetical protein
VRVYDMQSEALLGQTRAGRHGYFLLRTNVDEAPLGVTASVEVGGVEWMLEPVQVWKKSRCHSHRHDNRHVNRHDNRHDHRDRGDRSHRSCRNGRH